MKLSDFDYSLPPELIAQEPLPERHKSRLMVVDRATGSVSDHAFADILEFLTPKDLVVFNDTRVLPARLFGKKEETGGKVEVLLLRELHQAMWEALVSPSRRVRPGVRISFGEGQLTAIVRERTEAGTRILEFFPEGRFWDLLFCLGTVPLPPYIHKPLENPERYQTVYARKPGSVAAPTAGLHFSRAILERMDERGIERVCLTLHVGLGTFRPIRCENIEDHRMEEEYFSIPEETALKMNKALEEKKRIVAVGTTSARTLEAALGEDGMMGRCDGHTDLFIYPGFRFRCVGAILTNFHLPGSTLLLFVCAFAGRDLIFESYKRAIEKRYRFYSFGDAMLII